MQGAAWLQSQATSAAAFSASADVPLTPAAAASASQKTSPALGKHRRHASASSFTLPDQDFFNRPLDRGMPQPAPNKAASPVHSQADKLSSGHMAASMAADDSPAMSARVTGQQSLQKATIALKGLQTKYGQASSTAQSSSSGFGGISHKMLSGAADTEADSEADTAADSSGLESAAAPGRSSFSFDSPVGWRGAASISGGPQPSISRGLHASISGSAHPSSAGLNSEGTHPVSLRGPEPRSSAGAHSSSPGGARPSSSGEAHPSSSKGSPHSSGGAHPVSPGGVYPSKLREAHPSRSKESHPSNSADESSHAGEYFVLWVADCHTSCKQSIKIPVFLMLLTSCAQD